jgi:NADPH:quinone reductase-like Zn-dependent oxidoreductase
MSPALKLEIALQVSQSPRGVFSTFARIKAAFSFGISDDMSFETGASLPVAYCASLYGLIDLGRLSKDESVLIYGADSTPGQAAICLAQMIGAGVCATVSSLQTKALLKEASGLRDDQIIPSHELSSGLASGKSHFDVVLKCDSADAETFRELWDCLDNCGRFVEIEKQDTNTRLEISRLDNNRSFISVDLMSLAAKRPKVLERLLSEVSELLEQGKIGPMGQITVFPISDVEKAFRTLQSGKASGKWIVSPRAEDVVKVRVLFSPSKSSRGVES